MTVLFVPRGSRAALARRVGPGRVATWFAVLRAGGASCLSRLQEYQRRRRSRVYIWQLDDRQLKDIGITRAEGEWEGNKPFWMP
jgi:uncharacterized protein YjiS (DUF1127 family)